MRLFKLLQENRLFVHYLAIVIVILGILSLVSLRREARPNVNFNRLAVAIAYPGAAPSDVEDLVIDPIEEKIAEVDGVEEYRSVSFSGAGSISVLIDDEYPDPQYVMDEVRRKISEVRTLPTEVDDPVVSEIKASTIPVLKVALYGDLKPYELKLEAEKLKDYLKNFDGVQSVELQGIEDLQYKILTDPELLFKFDLTLAEVVDKTVKWGKQKPGGLLENAQQTTNITIGRNYNEIDSIKNLVVRSNSTGYSVAIKDVAEVIFDVEDSQQSTLFADKKAVLVTIVKKPFSDAIDVVETVKLGLEKYKKSLPKELQFKLYTDESKRVRDRLNVVATNALFGLFLVMGLLILFLDWRSALVTSLGIPVAILGGMVVIFLVGQTMNSLVLVGMIIVMGMLVDDAIVVCENIYSYIEKGHDSVEAALLGVSEIATPVIATVATTIFAFFPIIFMKEIMGQFLRVIPITVVALLSISLFEALVILPIHASELMKKVKEEKQTVFHKIERAYEKYLKWSIAHKAKIILALILFMILSMVQAKYQFSRFTLFPAVGLSGMSIRFEIEKNAPLDKTESLIKQLNGLILKTGEQNFDSIISTVGETRTGGSHGSRQLSTNLGKSDILFTSDPTFIDREQEVVNQIKKITKDFGDKHKAKISITLDRMGPPIGKPIQLQVTSRDLDVGKEVINKIRAKLETIPGTMDLESDLDGETKTYRFIIDEKTASSDLVDPSTISRTVYAATTGFMSNEVLKNNEKVEMLILTNQEKGIDVHDILKLRIRNRYNQDVELGVYVKAVEELGPSSIQRLNGLRTITLFGEVDESVSSGKIVNQKIAPFLNELRDQYSAVTIETGGGEKDRMNALNDTMKLYVLAIFLIFMTISLSFQSVFYPFLVLLSIPMGVFGAFWALSLHGMTLSLMGLIGIVGLSGVVVNVAIVLLKFVQDKIKQGTSPDDAIVEAGVRRLRPMVISTITTLIGLAPTIYGIGGVDTFVQPIALVLGWGLLVGTALTLFALPALVSLALKLKYRKGYPTRYNREEKQTNLKPVA